MKFSTAIKSLKSQEHEISLERYSTRLMVNKGLDDNDDLVIKSVELETGHGSVDKVQGKGDKAIEAMLIRHNMPLTGWLLDERYGPYPRKYNNPIVYFSILDAFRRNENLFRNLDQLCEMIAIKNNLTLRAVKIHALSLIEDHRGLFEEEDGSIRLMTWGEALAFSEPLAEIEQVQCANESEKRFGKPDIFVSRARIYLNGELHSHHWEVYPEGEGFTAHEYTGLYGPSGVSFHGKEHDVNSVFEEHCLPLGWGATYGRNVSDDLRDQEMARMYKNKRA